MSEQSPRKLQVVVVGNGMVGHRFVSEVVAAAVPGTVAFTVIGEERRPAYDRVALSSYVRTRSADDLTLADPTWYEANDVTLHLGDPVLGIDRATRIVRTAAGAELAYDHLVLATGSAPFVPPVDGADGPGCFVYRTIDDLDDLIAAAERPGMRRGVVIGGGLLGLEAADALRSLGLDTHVVEFAPRLMPVQLCDGGARMLRRHIEALGVQVHLGRATTAIEHDGDRARRLTFESHDPLDADIVVFSAGIRPRDQVGRDAGLDVGPRGGVAVDDQLVSADPHISAIGECAAVEGRTYGLVAPGYRMAALVAARLAAEAIGATPPAERFAPPDLSTKLKLLGVEVASVGDPHGDDDTDDVVWSDPTAKVFTRLVVDRATGALRGAVLVGDVSAYPTLLGALRTEGAPCPPVGVLVPGRVADDAGAPGAPDGLVCSCENVTGATICASVAAGCADVDAVKADTRAGTGCGGCLPIVATVVKSELQRAGVAVSDHLCEHLPFSRPDLFDLIRVRGIRSFAALMAEHGSGDGCDICKPAVASILASLDNTHILDGEGAALQDTNDHVLANLQRDGTYSVVPRIPGGEVTPAGLAVIAEVARDFDLYTKITGGQRIDLFGARLEQLPEIWRRLVDAGFESGHAYGKAVRTVKSCVGETWCRYGVADSTGMAIALEQRYRGLRAPHKLKFAVSGCVRECAEAQSKDVGVIATERGWNLFVGGNGGARPRHADLFVEDVDDEQLVRIIDRFLMFYIRTADRLERTAAWVSRFDGGLDRLRRIVVDDHLGLAAELEADMARHAATYECEWKATLDDPARLERFVSYVNAPHEPDPTVVFVRSRGQIRPATPAERAAAELVGVR